MISAFHHLYILLEPSPCASLTSPRLTGKKSRGECRNCIFSDSAHKLSIILCSLITKKVLENQHECYLFAANSAGLSLLLKSSRISSRIWGPIKTPFFSLASVFSTRNFTYEVLKTIIFHVHRLYEILMRRSLTCSDGK